MLSGQSADFLPARPADLRLAVKPGENPMAKFSDWRQSIKFCIFTPHLKKLTMSVNKVILVGHVGADPEVRYIESNTPVCNIRIATSEVYKNKNGEKVTSTEWHTVVLWRGLAEVAEKYVRKGSQLYIEGKIRTRSWDDKEGNKRYATEIIADVMQLLGKRDDSSTTTLPAAENKQTQGSPTIPETSPEADDLPF